MLMDHVVQCVLVRIKKGIKTSIGNSFERTIDNDRKNGRGTTIRIDIDYITAVLYIYIITRRRRMIIIAYQN